MTSTLAVTYHYVRPRGCDARGTRPLWSDEFCAQLDWLAAHFDIVSPAELFADAPGSRPRAILTFDDGTRDHAEVVAPILAERGLGAVFFVISGATIDGQLPTTHALHWLLGEDEDALWASCSAWIEERGGTVDDLGAIEDAHRVYHYEDSSLRARTKFALNRALPADVAATLVRELLRRSGVDEAALAREWFLDVDQLRALADAGHAIGGHGVTHQSVQQLGQAGALAEIERSIDALQVATGGAIEWFTLPFGGNETAPGVVAAIESRYQALGVRAAPNTLPGLITPKTPPLALPRIDAAHLPPRSQPPSTVEAAIRQSSPEGTQ